jgi:MSHA type pilus biogenesis protein MshL
MSKKMEKFGWLGALLLVLAACAPLPPPPERQLAPEHQSALIPPAADFPPPAAGVAAASEPMQLPVRFQRSSYLLNESDGAALGQEEEVAIQVGADISSTTGPVPLRDILKRLAGLKHMNVSWASDVDQFGLVDVDIRADDDFFEAIDHLLRQVDYFHEVKGNTIIVKYKETKKFHIAMPFVTSTYETGVGGDVLGGAKSLSDDAVKGNIKLYSAGNTFDVWKNIAENIDQILEIWSEPNPSSPPPSGEGEKQIATEAIRRPQSGKGYYSIDKPIGLITVTAPRPLLGKVTNYLDNLKTQLYRQVAIEAKILEVKLDDYSKKGLDWTALISNNPIRLELFGPAGVIYQPDPLRRADPHSDRVVSKISLPNNPFDIFLDAIEKQGRTKVLANPKISVMNGQPALISVGDSIRFIDEVKADRDEKGNVTFTTSTSTVMSGLGLSVVASIMEEDEIILSLTPVTSQLQNIRTIRIGDGSIMLPEVRLREMNTVVRIKDGGMLVVGGLIDESDNTGDTRVPILGGLPVVNWLFKSETKRKEKTELVILLRPQIMP